MKELSKKDLQKIEGGWVKDLVDLVIDAVFGTGPIGRTRAYCCYYRAQMPANWTGLGH